MSLAKEIVVVLDRGLRLILFRNGAGRRFLRSAIELVGPDENRARALPSASCSRSWSSSSDRAQAARAGSRPLSCRRSLDGEPRFVSPAGLLLITTGSGGGADARRRPAGAKRRREGAGRRLTEKRPDGLSGRGGAGTPTAQASDPRARYWPGRVTPAQPGEQHGTSPPGALRTRWTRRSDRAGCSKPNPTSRAAANDHLHQADGYEKQHAITIPGRIRKDRHTAHELTRDGSSSRMERRPLPAAAWPRPNRRPSVRSSSSLKERGVSVPRLRAGDLVDLSGQAAEGRQPHLAQLGEELEPPRPPRCALSDDLGVPSARPPRRRDGAGGAGGGSATAASGTGGIWSASGWLCSSTVSAWPGWLPRPEPARPVAAERRPRSRPGCPEAAGDRCATAQRRRSGPRSDGSGDRRSAGDRRHIRGAPRRTVASWATSLLQGARSASSTMLAARASASRMMALAWACPSESNAAACSRASWIAASAVRCASTSVRRRASSPSVDSAAIRSVLDPFGCARSRSCRISCRPATRSKELIDVLGVIAARLRGTRPRGPSLARRHAAIVAFASGLTADRRLQVG